MKILQRCGGGIYFFLCCWLLSFYTCKLPVFHWVRQIYCCYYAIYTFIGSLGKSSRKKGIFYCWLELKWNENQWKMEQVEQKESWGIRLKLRGNETELMMWVFCCDIRGFFVFPIWIVDCYCFAEFGIKMDAVNNFYWAINKIYV